MSLVLLRQIIELERHKWNEIIPSIKEKIKIASLNIIINDNLIKSDLSEDIFR